MESEKSYDFFEFTITPNVSFTVRESGIVLNKTILTPVLSSGNYIATWKYSKDGIISSGMDQVRIKQIRLFTDNCSTRTLAPTQAPTIAPSLAPVATNTPIATRTPVIVKFSIDNYLYGFYLNGAQVRGNNSIEWMETQTIELSLKENDVVAVYGYNTQAQQGVLAEIVDKNTGRVITTTGSHWRCSGNVNLDKGSNFTGYNSPVTYGNNNNNAVWGTRPSISLNAMWIWDISSQREYSYSVCKVQITQEMLLSNRSEPTHTPTPTATQFSRIPSPSPQVSSASVVGFNFVILLFTLLFLMF
ncbi:phosphate import ATP-binding protein PstB [Acrasis kona]|uniref:Phosphate import ATP-binding protein PstB n=1 Tax=Acrasis kona TaxID=1008807 RepID=A0AAW2YVH6_9EUKA